MIKLQKRRAKQWFLIDGMRGEGQLVSEQKKSLYPDCDGS